MAPRKRAKKDVAARSHPRRDRAFPLCERYAPVTESELAIYGKTVQRVKEWIATNESGLLIIAGRPGIGKSTMVDVVCDTLGVRRLRWRDTHGIGGTDESQAAEFGGFARGAACRALKLRGQRDQRSILVIEELPDLRYNLDETRSWLLSLASESDRPAVLVWSDGITEKSEARHVIEKAIGADLVQAATYVECNPVTQKQIAARLAAVARAEGHPLSTPTLEAIAAESDGDLRRAITRLDFVLRRPLADVDEQDASRVSDLHAVGRLLRAKRDANGALNFDPENLVQSMAMESDACAAFVQFNCVEFFDDLVDLAMALDVLSAGDSFGWRPSDGGFSHAYVASFAGRAVASFNRHPAPSAWRPIRRPALYDVLRARKDEVASLGNLRIRRRLDVPAALASRSDDAATLPCLLRESPSSPSPDDDAALLVADDLDSPLIEDDIQDFDD